MAVGLRASKHTSKKTASRLRRQIRVRKKISGTPERPRLVVTKSARHLFAQVVDDVAGKTLASASTMEADLRSSGDDKTAKAKTVGGLLAEPARAASVSRPGDTINGMEGSST